MTFKGIKQTIIWSFIWVIVSATGYAAEGDFDLGDWESQWMDFETRENLSNGERLSLQTELLEGVGPLVAWRNQTVWDWTLEVLAGWERSPEIEKARMAYFSILNKIGLAGLESADRLPDEAALRNLLQRALGVVRTPDREGLLLFHLGESLLRSTPDSDENRRRVEAFFQQAILSMANQPPKDLIHFRFAQLYSRWEASPGSLEGSEQPYMSRAAFQYRSVIEMESARPDLKEKANQALSLLLNPEMELTPMSRFLPRNDVRVSASTRNLEQVKIEILSMPPMQMEQVLTLKELKAVNAGEDWNVDRLIFSKEFPIVQRNRIDWQEHEFRLGESFNSGWYWIRVTGENIVVEDLMLVTPLEIVLIPRSSTSSTLWVADVETGMPVPNATFRIIDNKGDLVSTVLSDLNGLCEVDDLEALDWEEIHVRDGMNPGVVRRADLPHKAPSTPWVIPHSVQVLPGMSLKWTLIGSSEATLAQYESSTLVHLPDGTTLIPEVKRTGDRMLGAEVLIPEEKQTSGQIFLELPDHRKLFLAHLYQVESFPLEVEFSGESYSRNGNLFLDTSPVGVRLIDVSPNVNSLPEYIRVRVSKVSRRFVYSEEETVADDAPEVIYENIFSLSGSGSVAAFFELPVLKGLEAIQPLEVQVFPLSGEGLLACEHLALVPYRGQVNLSIDQQILHEGEVINVKLGIPEAGNIVSRSPEGDLILYRETWESRYIHRNRGTIIQEKAYLDLPDRSLLGSAKTDYRLLEKGFIREEVQRIKIGLLEEATIPVELVLPGYYRIEFDGGNLEVRPRYPDGPLEVWVIPDSGNLRAFRSEKRRMIVEKSPDGGDQILILLDDAEASVLLDCEYEDGRVSTTVLRSGAAALFQEVPSADSGKLTLCRAVVMGGRITDFLHGNPTNDEEVRWELKEQSQSGLNPGAAFSWPIALQKGRLDGPLIWGIYPQGAQEIIDSHLHLQKRMRTRELIELSQDMGSLGTWLPLYNPLGQTRSTGSSLTQNLTIMGDSSATALFPELCQGEVSVGTSLTIATDQESQQIEGILPGSVGQWQITLFSLFGQDWVSWDSWAVSTELPIRTSLKGPSYLRETDEAVIPLIVENTTLDREALNVELETSGTLELASPSRMEKVFIPGQKVEFPVAFGSEGPGGGMLTARTVGDDSSEAYLRVQTIAAERSHGLKVYGIDPSDVPWRKDVALENWTGGRVLASAALGNLLPEMWESSRHSFVDAEPLLAYLGDWALENSLLRHGIIDTPDTEITRVLLDQLKPLHTDDGGWAWAQGHPADPWLTALVLWGLETFSLPDTDWIADMRSQSRDLLELILIRDEVTTESRLFALRALSVPALKGQEARPSRIQAKAFLELLHNRADLANAELAILLQVARAYGFSEEVGLLSGELSSRVRNQDDAYSGSFWEYSLVYASLGEIKELRAVRSEILAAAFEEVSITSSARGWKHASAVLNLLASFFWEGDFDVEGDAVVLVDEEAPVTLPLNPAGKGGGVLSRDLSAKVINDGQISLAVSALDSPKPMYILLSGQLSEGIDAPAYGEQSELVYREFVEKTLLAGTRIQVIPADEETILRTGDTLQVHLSLYVEDTKPFAEFSFSIPAGAVLGNDAIQHALEPYSSEAIFTQPIISQVEQKNPLRQVIRMEPLVSGRHEFILSYKINWAGTFTFPPHRMTLPMSGERFQLGSLRQLNVAAEETE